MKLRTTLLFLLITSLITAACNNNKKQVAADPDIYYTCSMHPQVMQDHPGTCPICHMDLIAVSKAGQSDEGIMLSDEQIRLGNIHTDTIGQTAMGDRVVLTGTLNFDETNVNTVSARIMGRIDRLYYKTEGDYVAKGAHLYDLYSEELNTAKQEYVAALERQEKLGNSIIDFKQLLQSAKNKLLLWGMSEAQVNELARTRSASPLTAFYSTAAGYITELPVKEGEYVMEGGPVVKLAGLQTLWAEAQVYASQLSAVDEQGTATVQLPDMPGTEIKGKISFANPEISSGTRINLVRISIPNTGSRLKPGMPAYVLLKNTQRNTLTLPVDAVLRDGTMATVWIKKDDNTFVAKMVETGAESGNRIEITNGLQAGDIVVVSGAYLLNSEYIFKKGAEPMAEHKH